MKRIFCLIILIAAVAFTSCKKFLDVKPRDQVIADELFTSEAGFIKALNGVYLSMTKEATYGGAMTMEMVEILGQRYSITNSHRKYQLSLYNYTDEGVKLQTGNVWAGMYSHIAAINKILTALKEHPEVVREDHRKWMTGELLGLRAFLHFDVLRLFGPMYGADSTAARVPYYTVFTDRYLPFLPANQVAKNVLQDIDNAEALLETDPVVKDGRTYTGDAVSGSYAWRSRQFRMNLYAVQALKARVYLYTKAPAAALEYAKKVIANTAQQFPFALPGAHLGTNPNRVFASEVLFALQDLNLDQKFQQYYAPTLDDEEILAANLNRLNTEYENNGNDGRFFNTWVLPSNGSKNYKCFYKYADIDRPADYNYVYHIPMIRISEMYFIAAECEPVKTTALGYLNTVRKVRNVTDAAATATLSAELLKDYKREFYGEGQCFFYYKRVNTTSVPNGSAASGNVTMNAAKYVVPIPENELKYRN